MSLFWRIFLLNAAVLVAAGALLLLGPITISTPVLLTEAMILTGGIAFMLAANAALLRLGLFPLQRVTRAMTTTDLLRPSPRPEVAGHGEIAALIETFNTMLDRLEAERATSSARALSAQEAERRRVAQELHDEVGQTLTAVLLELKRVADHAPEPLRGELRQVQEITRGSLDEIRRIARRLRPGVLEELGLVSALTALITETPTPDGLTIRRRMGKDLPELGAEAELVVYRIAQEALTNTVRHARATRLELSLRRSRRSGTAHPRRRPRPRGCPGGGGPAWYARTRSADRGRGLPRSGAAGRHRSTSRCARPERKQVTMPTSPSIAMPSRGATAPTRILLADDHALVRRGVRLILDGEPDLTVVAEAGDGAEAIEMARAERPDLVILDIAMPRLTGLQAARELSRVMPGLRILMLTMYDNEQYFFEALKAGAAGYVLKSVADRDLVEACRAAMRDEPFLYPGAVTALIRNFLDRAKDGEDLPARAITEREEEILKLVAEGHSSKEIAELLVISVKTVERHRANLLQKLGLRDRLELTRYAIRAGLIEP